MSPERSLPKKQELISIAGTSAGKITNKPNFKYTNAYNEMVEKNAMERMLKRMEKNVNPGSSGSSGTEFKFISDFQKELDNHLLDKDTKICSLEEDLKFIKHVLEKTKCNLKNERAEKEKIANELSELRLTLRNLSETSTQK